jgi:BirA family transcriptional regulator, biotin operon repressor / biotin---[acetyl-CoA-carboxylase] ligase
MVMVTDALTHFFAELARSGAAPLSAWPLDDDVELFGLERRGDLVVPTAPFDPLDSTAIRAELSPQVRGWLRELAVLPVIGSTNRELMERAERGSVDGCVCLAELQVQGRGRRGRTWFSPFGANLAVSIGIAAASPPSALGGASLVVGLAVVDALEQLGASGLGLKWPNDVLLRGAKLGGILIEMTQSASGVQLVIGVGLNVVVPAPLRAKLEVPVADLASSGVSAGRSLLAGRVITSVVEFVGQFARVGFVPFIEVFNAKHAFHHREVQILQGEKRISGRVSGVSEQGGLVLQTATGLTEFHGGEVSLRGQS